MTAKDLDDTRFKSLIPKLQEAHHDKYKHVRGLYPNYSSNGERKTQLAAVYEVVCPLQTTGFEELSKEQQRYENTQHSKPLIRCNPRKHGNLNE